MATDDASLATIDIPFGAQWKKEMPSEVKRELDSSGGSDWIGQATEQKTVGHGSTGAGGYRNIDPPAVIQIPVVHCNDHSNPRTARRHYSGTLKAETVRELPWALCSANPREPSHNKVVEKIQETVLEEPSEMQCRNGGLTMVASAAHLDNARDNLVLGLKSREGLVNGGHTQLALSALEDPIDARALVEFEVIVLEPGLNDDGRVRVATDIAEKRNWEQELEERSLADHRGFYNRLKERVDERLISWHENDSEVYKAKDAIDSDHFIRLAGVLDPERHVSYYDTTKAGHGGPTTSKSGVHGDWFETVKSIEESSEEEETISRPFKHVFPILPSVLEMRDAIAASLWKADLTEDVAGGTRIRGNSLWDQYIKNDDGDDHPPSRRLYARRFEDELGVKLSTTFEALLLGYQRGNVWLPDQRGTIAGWFQDPLALWEQHKVRKLDTINDAVDFTGHGGVTFSRNALLFREEQLLGVDARHEGELPTPEVIYDDQTRARFFRVGDDAFGYDVPTLVETDADVHGPGDATHLLDEDNGELVEVETARAEAIGDVPRYRVDTDEFFHQP